MLGQDREVIRPDVVGGVAVSRDSIRAGKNRIDLILFHESRGHVITN